ncbi:TNT domain-containing protein [Streptomyces sp. NPDC092296]|uniref:TNT domain-containing protein n=1 Tax=Streptomyces sp. NPDC092296 TaxID=3366012 RepID=UPI0037FE5D45
MKVRRILAVLAATAALLTGALPAAAAPSAVGTGTVATSRSADSLSDLLTQCSADFVQGDSRLGPQRLPLLGIVGAEVFGYLRTGSLSPQKFLAQYWDPAAGAWIYPPQDGYVLNLDGTPLKTSTTLRPGQDIDRYGSEYGAFLAPEGLSYAGRSIPPSSLDGTPAAGCNYHDYRVLKQFTVYSGPIASWFGQPGHGIQYQLDRTLVPGAPEQGFNVGWLVDQGYLKRLV